MKKLILLTLSSFVVFGCATIGTTPNQPDIDQAIATAKQINSISTALLNSAGPMVVAGICIVQPQDCVPAKTAFALAQGTNAEIANLIAASEAAHAAPDGQKLASLASSFAADIGNINKLIAGYGGKPIDLTLYQSMITDIPQGVAK